MELYKTDDDLINSYIDETTGEIIELKTSEEQSKELVIALIKKIKNLKAKHEMFKAEADRLKDEASSTKASIESTKGFLKGVLEMNNIKKHSDGVHSVTLRKPTASLNVLDESEVPTEYFKEVVKTSIDKKQLLSDIKDGKEVKGAEIEYKSGLLIK